ncbi:MAG: putative nucleotidyltransferase [Parcubacteria group bacterium Gr01-1014_2]|nr:MAG: putative nucleotidyltransferase [Parcubacteria group bacterium Gr01-1014_2]
MDELKIMRKYKIPEPYKPERHPKGWGYEDWVVNKKYCGKLLFFQKGKRCSFHYHEKKYETFFLLSGKMEIRVGWKDDVNGREVKSYILNPGDCLEIPRGLRHQMIALENSKLFEFSTTHFEEDSKRIIKGD